MKPVHVEAARLNAAQLDSAAMIVIAAHDDLQAALDELVTLRQERKDGALHEESLEMVSDNLMATAIASAEEVKGLQAEKVRLAGDVAKLWKMLLGAQSCLRSGGADVLTLQQIRRVLEDTSPGKRKDGGAWTAAKTT